MEIKTLLYIIIGMQVVAFPFALRLAWAIGAHNSDGTNMILEAIRNRGTK